MPVPPTPAHLDIDRIDADLAHCRVGHPLDYTPSLSSTMDRAAALIAAGAPTGAIVLTEEQTAGRGRRGRTWHAPFATALQVSIVLRPPQLQVPASHLPMLAGVALVEAVTELAPELARELSLKWPNDLMLGTDPATANKTGGILVESHLRPDGTVAAAVIGLGINANQCREDLPPVPAPFPAPDQPCAASGSPRGPQPPARAALSADGGLARRPRRGIRLAWRRHLSTLGQTVTLYPQGVEAAPLLTGRALAVDDHGRLIVADRDGEQHVFDAGDVSVRITG